MSFVKRADGITYNTGGHVMSRGTLEQVKYGSTKESTPQDESWLKQVTATLMSVEDSLLLKSYALDGWMNQDNDIISKLWGVYYNTCPHIRRSFNDNYFYPNY